MDVNNRDEIIKALECCSGADGTTTCDSCVYYEEGDKVDCTQILTDALTLIKSLTATNESLEAAIVALKEEIGMVRADTIKTFTKRLKRYYEDGERYLGYSIAYNIDQVAKAMLHQLTPTYTNSHQLTPPDNKCVACGDIIPEGRQVCPGCEGGENGTGQAD